MLHTQGHQQLDVLLVEVVMVCCQVSCVVAKHVAWCLAESVPDAWRAATFIPAPFNLAKQSKSAMISHVCSIRVDKCRSLDQQHLPLGDGGVCVCGGGGAIATAG